MIKIGVLGYGNLGRGVLRAVKQNPDLQTVAVFTRRDPSSLKLDDPAIPVVSMDAMADWKDRIDVMILCGGSATDLPKQGPQAAALFNTVDSFDTHAKIPQYFADMDAALKDSGKIGIISVGWDPGLFSLNRLYMESVLADGKTYTFWGKGVSQGHSDAIRRVSGVRKGVQYTVPVEEVINAIRSGDCSDFTTRQKHRRVCYVVAEEGADRAAIEREIVTMPNYFADYDTTVNFIDEATFDAEHGSAMPHGGFVIRNGKTLGGNGHTMEFSLRLESNPEFTASVLVAYARAIAKLAAKGETGCRTVLDIAPSLLSPKSEADLRKELL